MSDIDIIMEDPRWKGLDALASRAVPETLRHMGFDPGAHEVAILGCDDAKIAGLNADFRGKPQPTNVLSWPAMELAPGDPPQPELGDIAIAFGVCTREAGEQGKPFDAHVTHLLVHATLHLLGYDHQNDAEAEEMERLEAEILGNLGIANPY